MKWYTQSEYVDIQTGEKITKYEAENKYRIIKKTQKYEHKSQITNKGTETYGIRTIINECTQNGRQQTIW